MAEPLLLLPFAAWAARDLDASLYLSWPGAAFACVGSKLSRMPRPTAPREAEQVVFTSSLVPGAAELESYHTGAPRRDVSNEQMGRLAAWVGRTYVPASMESRLAGAGAGLTDND